MWIFVAFVDDAIVAAPISWVIKCNGEKKCFWPLQDERLKRSKNEIPPSFGMNMDGCELHDCTVLLNGAIFDDFEEALAIEMDGIDIDDKTIVERPRLSWNDEIVNVANPPEISVGNDKSYFEFRDYLQSQNLCSTIVKENKNCVTTEINITEEGALPITQSEMLDTILKYQEEKKKILIKLLGKMYSLEQAVGYHS